VAKVCFILIAGLDQQLLSRTPELSALASFDVRKPLQPVTPAVTCTMQATLSTGRPPGQHGIIANGLYTHNRAELQSHLDLSSFPEFRRNTSFWEQSNHLLGAPRFWQASKGWRGKVAMLFWQNSMDGAADIVLTPKPTHTPDGKTMTACWSSPADLYAQLTAQYGPFPLMNYWGPMASLPSSQWIIRAAQDVWKTHAPDLELVYIPHMDYSLQRVGPDHPVVIKEMQALDAALLPFIESVRASGGIPIVAGDYSITNVSRAILPNLALREAGLLLAKADEQGKLLVDYDGSAAFAMVDHQIAHIYCAPGRRGEVVRALAATGERGGRILTEPAEIDALGLKSDRSGDIILLAPPDAWFAHDWWPLGSAGDAEKPAWQFSVDIHRKPGYDPRELFFDPARKCIAQDPGLVKGSHGLVSRDPAGWPALLCGRDVAPAGETIAATAVAGWLEHLLK